MDSVLKEKYQQNPECNAAALSYGAEIAADAVDAEKTQGLMAAILSYKLMRCDGWSIKQILSLYASFIVIIVLVTFLLPLALPDSWFKNCKINGRTATAEECLKDSQKIKYIIGAVLGLVICGIISHIIKWRLKLKIFKFGALATGEIAKTVM